jgi:predicted DCC family thiol-disulfide oxidoreductase YuxK
MGKVDVELVDFHAAESLERFPGLTYEICMERMHLVEPAGQIFAGAEGIVRAISTGGFPGKLALIYFVPGMRQLCNGIYRLIAAHRYRVMGRAITAGQCADETCSLHLGKQRDQCLSEPRP